MTGCLVLSRCYTELSQECMECFLSGIRDRSPCGECFRLSGSEKKDRGGKTLERFINTSANIKKESRRAEV